MNASDFMLDREIKFDFENGYTTFRDSRILIFSSDAIGLLRQSLIKKLGFEAARDFFLQLGFQNGFSDFMQINIGYSFNNEQQLFSSGPVIHTYEGIVKAIPEEFHLDREKGEFMARGLWLNSYEADQHLFYNELAHEPVCWSLMGYASGWSTAFFGDTAIAIEPVCRGMGDDHCEFLIQTPDKWGESVRIYLNAYKEILSRLSKNRSV